MLVSTLRFPMRVPPSYCGSRILLCVVLSISVAAFFLIYDRVTLRGTPSVSDSLKPQTIVAQPNPIRGYGSFNEPAAPDMNATEVKFASADVLPSEDTTGPGTVEPRKSQIKLTEEPKQQDRLRSVQRQKAKSTRNARIKVRSQGRAAYAQSYSPGFGMFRPF